MLRLLKNTNYILLFLIITMIFLNGCTVDQINQQQEKEHVLDTQEEIIIDEEKNYNNEELKESEPSLPADILERGFANEEERKQNGEGTYAYVLYGTPCRAEYLQRDFKANCLLQIIDLQKDEVMLEFQANENGIFEIGDVSFNPPIGWHDDESLLIFYGFGDAGVSVGTYESFNILTHQLEHIYSFDSISSIGTLYTINGRNLFFKAPTYSDEDEINLLTIYEVPEAIKDVLDTEEADVSTFKKLNEIEGGDSSEYRMDDGFFVHVDTDADYRTDTLYKYDLEANRFIPADSL